MYSFDLKTNSYYILSLVLSICALFLSTELASLLFLAILIIGFLIQRGYNILLIAIIIGYLSFTSEFFSHLRTLINITITILLLYLFLKQYGFDFSIYPKIPKGLFYFFILLSVTLIFSTIYSESFVISLLASIRTIFFFVIVYLFYGVVTTEKDIKTLIFTLILVMLIVGIPMFIDLYNLGFQKYFIKSILSENINLYTSKGYTGMTLLFIATAFIVVMFFWNEVNNIKSKIILTILLLFNIIFLILANSRGGILAAMIGSGFILFKLERRIFVRSFLFFLSTLLLLYFFVPAINDAVNLYLRWETLGDREVYWQMGIDVINDYNIFGVGPDLFDKLFFNYAPSTTINYFKLGNLSLGKPHPHNFFIYFTAENGILGLITSIAFFVLIFYYSFKTIKLAKQRKDFYYLLALAITGIIIGIFFRAFIEVTGFLIYGYISRDLPFWIIFIILIRAYQRYDNNEIINKPSI